jgi:hypothetical protein
MRRASPSRCRNHFAVTYVDGLLRLYKNGLLLLDLTEQGFLDSVRMPPAADVDPLFPGRVSHVTVWSRQLQPNEVAMAMHGKVEPDGGQSIADQHRSPTPSREIPRSGWQAHVPPQTKHCKAAVVLTVTDAAANLELSTAHLIRHAGPGCEVFLIYVMQAATASGNDRGPDGQYEIVRHVLEASKMAWLDGIRAALERIQAQHSDVPYVVFASPWHLPMDGWLSGLVAECEADETVGAAFSLIANPNGTILSAGIEFQEAYQPYLDQQVLMPVEAFAGYPINYAPASVPGDAKATHCGGLLLRTKILQQLLSEGASVHDQLDSHYACLDLTLRLRQMGRRLRRAPRSVFISMRYNTTADVGGKALKAFEAAWGLQLRSSWASKLSHNATVTW